jgi:hypothetical protein
VLGSPIERDGPNCGEPAAWVLLAHLPAAAAGALGEPFRGSRRTHSGRGGRRPGAPFPELAGGGRQRLKPRCSCARWPDEVAWVGRGEGRPADAVLPAGRRVRRKRRCTATAKRSSARTTFRSPRCNTSPLGVPHRKRRASWGDLRGVGAVDARFRRRRGREGGGTLWTTPTSRCALGCVCVCACVQQCSVTVRYSDYINNQHVVSSLLLSLISLHHHR